MAIADDHWMYLDGVESNPSTASIGQAVMTPDGQQPRMQSGVKG